MAYIKFTNTHTPFVQVPTWFITRYMPSALGGYIKVYLYLLYLQSSTVETSSSLEDISKNLDMLYSELISAIEYWHEQKVLSFEVTPNGDYCLNLLEVEPEQKKASSASPRLFVQQTRPLYTADELNVYKKQHPSIAQLFMICEKYLGRLLSSTDQQVLFGLYDWLNMPLDLIEYLVEYCASNGHTRIRYIEKVALNWVDEGILTVESAKRQTAVTQKYRAIFKALGMNSETITKQHKTLFDKWLHEYQFDLPIILEACNRTVTHTTQPSLKYLDSILTAWYDAKVKTLKDIEELDVMHGEKQKQKQERSSGTSPKKLSSKNPYFTTIHSHDWDMDELDQLAQDYIDVKLYGGN